MRELDWSILDQQDVEAAWTKISEVLGDLTEKYVPSVNPKKSKKKATPWWNQKLTKLVKAKHAAWIKYTKTEADADHKKYTMQRNKTTATLKATRKSYEDNLIKEVKREPKKLYKYVRLQQKVKPTVGPLMSNGQLSQSDQEAAEILQRFFKSVYVREEAGTLPSFPDMVDEEDCTEDVTFNSEDVALMLKSLDMEKAAGPDNIPSILLNKCAEQLAVPLFKLFRKTLDEGIIPQVWKTAKIVPIHKKGTRTKAENYRPVSLTSQVSKVMERLIKKEILSHLARNELITKHQHGFVSKKSCQTNLIETLDDWTSELDEGRALDAIYLDFEKAFDSVPHRRLIMKLNRHGLSGKLLNWLQSFLTDRMQQVVVGEGASGWCKVTSGVPQGSVLGPVLFTIYVNDLPGQTISSMKMFADDAKLYRPISSPADSQTLQHDLKKLEQWSDSWLLRFNASKCKIMHLGATNTKEDYYMRDNHGQERKLEETVLEKDLGIYVSNTLKPTEHCHRAASKAMSALRILYNVFDSLNETNFPVLYTTFVRPHLDYCLSAVGPYMVQDFQALEKVQRRATRLVSSIRHLSYPERLAKLKLPKMRDRVLRGDLIETYKILTKKVDIDSEKLFVKHEDSKTRGHHLKLRKKRSHLLLRSNFFCNRVLTSWNNLPESVILAETTNNFKKQLDQYWTTITHNDTQ